MWAFYRWFFISLPVKRIKADGALQLLNEEESAYLRTVRGRSVWLGILTALLCNGVLFFPFHVFPHLFPVVLVSLPFFKEAIPVPLGEIVWMIPIIFLEILLLTLINIATVHEVAVATGYINDKNEVERTNDVLRIALATPAKELEKLGINPYQGVNRFGLLAFNAILLFKGAVMAQLVRQILIRILGGYAIREILDYSGVPIYATIDALGCRKIAYEAQVIIMGEAIIEQLRRRLPDRKLKPDEARLLYDTLQFIAINKRDYHRNHYSLSRMVLNHFGIPPEPEHPLPDDYHTRLDDAPAQIGDLCALITVLGFVLDGKLSYQERRRIASLNADGVLREEFDEVRHYVKEFIDGKGVENLFQRYISD